MPRVRGVCWPGLGKWVCLGECAFIVAGRWVAVSEVRLHAPWSEDDSFMAAVTFTALGQADRLPITAYRVALLGNRIA